MCAPSNGAIDELVHRVISRGFLTTEGIKYIPKIVRIGKSSEKHVNRLVSSVTLEYLVNESKYDNNNTFDKGNHKNKKKINNMEIENTILSKNNIYACTISSCVLEKITKLKKKFK